MARAKAHGLILIDRDVNSVNAHANVHGKLYESRDGFGLYYRYEPRDIEALCVNQRNKVDKVKPGSFKIHETVIERIKRGTAHYAPGFLPCEFNIVSTNPDVAPRKISFNQDEWAKCRSEVKKWVQQRQWLYRIFVESTLVIIAVAIAFWQQPPESLLAFQQAGNSDAIITDTRMDLHNHKQVAAIFFQQFS